MEINTEGIVNADDVLNYNPSSDFTFSEIMVMGDTSQSSSDISSVLCDTPGSSKSNNKILLKDLMADVIEYQLNKSTNSPRVTGSDIVSEFTDEDLVMDDSFVPESFVPTVILSQSDDVLKYTDQGSDQEIRYSKSDQVFLEQILKDCGKDTASNSWKSLMDDMQLAPDEENLVSLSGNGNYACNQCHKTFELEKNLKDHVCCASDKMKDDIEGNFENNHHSFVPERKEKIDPGIFVLVYNTLNIPYSRISRILMPYDLTESQIESIKKLRRCMKNRAYAKNKHNKTISAIENLRNELKMIRLRKRALLDERKDMYTTLRNYARKYNLLRTHIVLSFTKKNDELDTAAADEIEFPDGLDCFECPVLEKHRIGVKQLSVERRSLACKKARMNKRYGQLHDHIFSVLDKRIRGKNDSLCVEITESGYDEVNNENQMASVTSSIMDSTEEGSKMTDTPEIMDEFGVDRGLDIVEINGFEEEGDRAGSFDGVQVECLDREEVVVVEQAESVGVVEVAKQAEKDLESDGSSFSSDNNNRTRPMYWFEGASQNSFLKKLQRLRAERRRLLKERKKWRGKHEHLYNYLFSAGTPRSQYLLKSYIAFTVELLKTPQGKFIDVPEETTSIES